MTEQVTDLPILDLNNFKKDFAWQDYAKCKDQPYEVFFPNVGTGGVYRLKRAVAHAQTICATCPVAYKCYTSAVRRKEQHGIWGGVNFNFPTFTTIPIKQIKMKQRYRAFFYKIWEWKLRDVGK